jgi:hypothetical protein
MLSKTINGKEYLFVKVPEDAQGGHFEWEEASVFYYDEEGRQRQIGMPDTKHYEVIGKASELTEDQWREIVENDPISWFLFKSYESVLAVGYHFAHQSGKSLLRTLGLEPKTTLIIEKLC